MIWHTATIPLDLLPGRLAMIRKAHGTIVRSVPSSAGIKLTWAIPA